MKYLLRFCVFALAAAVGTGVALADTVSVVSNSSTVFYTSGPVHYTGTTTAPGGPATALEGLTYDIGTGGVWSAPVSSGTTQSSWVSFDPNTAPNGTDAQGNPNPLVPDGTYVYSTNFDLTGSPDYTGTLTVLADDTTAVYLNGTEIIGPGSGEGVNCVVTGPTCTMTYTLNDIIFANGENNLTFDVNQDYGYATGLDFAATISGTPEPSSLILLGTGLLGAAGALRRRLRA